MTGVSLGCVVVGGGGWTDGWVGGYVAIATTVASQGVCVWLWGGWVWCLYIPTHGGTDTERDTHTQTPTRTQTQTQTHASRTHGEERRHGGDVTTPLVRVPGGGAQADGEEDEERDEVPAWGPRQPAAAVAPLLVWGGEWCECVQGRRCSLVNLGGGRGAVGGCGFVLKGGEW